MKPSNRAWEYQCAKARALKDLTYLEISRLYPRKEIEPPPDLKKWQFHVVRADGRNGGLRVEVEARTRFFGIFQSVTSIGFEKMNDGTIVDDDFEEKELED